MATDVGEIVGSLVQFYDWTDRSVVEVGAGGGQLIEFARAARRVVAVDKHTAGVARLRARVREVGLEDRFTVLTDDFLAVRPAGDVVLLEFCLHQMPDPARALQHALSIAADVVVIDHAPGSRWSWYAGEDELVEAAWAAVAAVGVRRRAAASGRQRFRDFDELAARLAAQGPTSRARIEELRGRADIEVPMPYELALVAGRP
jgi:SAM-dependent methyltransferase